MSYLNEKSSAIIERCIDGLQDEKITGSIIRDHVKSPFITYCNKFVSDEEKDPENRYLSLLAEKGNSHEEEIVASVFPRAYSNQFEDPVEAFGFAIAGMMKGANSFANFPMYYGTLKFEGFIDVLRRNDAHASIFGNHHYEIIEIKLAKHIKKPHILQAAFYNRLIGHIQQYIPPKFFLINGEGQETSYDYNTYSPQLDQVLDEIRTIWEQQHIPRPVYGLDLFPWTRFSDKEALKTHDLTIIPDIGEKIRDGLIKNGFDSIEKINGSDISELTQVKGIGQKKASSIRHWAKALNQEETICIKPIDLPFHPPEIYIDLEGLDPTLTPEKLQPIDFLYGALVVDEKDAIYHSFVIYNPYDAEECKKVLLDFLKFLESIPEVSIYHWGSYERSQIRKHAENYGLETYANKILSRLVDLRSVMKECLIVPLPSRSLKSLAQYVGFQWRMQDMSGRDAIVQYLEYLNNEQRDKNDLNGILSYNMDDVMALWHLKRWMIENTANI